MQAASQRIFTAFLQESAHRTIVTLYVPENAGEQLFRVCHILLDKSLEIRPRFFPVLQVGVEVLFVSFKVQLELARFLRRIRCSLIVGDAITNEKCGLGLFNAVSGNFAKCLTFSHVFQEIPLFEQILSDIRSRIFPAFRDGDCFNLKNTRAAGFFFLSDIVRHFRAYGFFLHAGSTGRVSLRREELRWHSLSLLYALQSIPCNRQCPF